MKKLHNNDLFWAAGLLEGEGCFSLEKHGNKVRIRITCSTTDKDVRDKLLHIFGGSSREVEKKPYKKQYCWYISKGSIVVDIMQILQPIMSMRRAKQIDKCLVSYENRTRATTWYSFRNIITGEMSCGYNLSVFCRKRNLRRQSMSAINLGTRKCHKNWIKKY